MRCPSIPRFTRLQVLDFMCLIMFLLMASDVRPAAGATAPSPAYVYAAPPLRASSAALLDASTGRWLLLDNADAPRPPASTAKIMTALVALGSGRLDTTAVADPSAVAVGTATGSSMGLVAGERLSLRDLLYGLLLPSGNDAALTIAKLVAGSVPAFVELMNREVAALGLTHTHFATPHGLDAPDQYSSARDLALLARQAMANPLFRTIVSTPSYTIPATAQHYRHVLANINWFLRWYPGADGVKPGSTGEAGLCQVLSAHRHGRWLIGVLMNTPDLYTDARDLMNYGFGDFRWTPSHQTGDTLDAGVAAGMASDPELYSPATGHRVRAGFLDYWRRHGGIAVLGLPLTDEFVEDGVTVQYFVNARLWWDEAAQAAVASPLGEAAMPASAIQRPVAPVAEGPAWRYVPVTGHIIRGAILSFYLAWGGADTFGYPLTEELSANGMTVQYFTNVELRWSTRRGVILAPLGGLALRQRG